jgi:hypothetical protein
LALGDVRQRALGADVVRQARPGPVVVVREGVRALVQAPGEALPRAQARRREDDCEAVTAWRARA